MSCPLFFVVARVVGSDGSLEKWKDRLVGLCGVSATEPLGNSYYWGHDLDGEPDTLWGLEGYTHPAGFFLGHTSTDTFKHEMRLADEDKLLKTVQGIGSPDYDLHHYDFAGGWLKREDDDFKDSKDSAVAVVHFWTSDKDRALVIQRLNDFAASRRATKSNQGSLQSCGVLKEVMQPNLTTLWLRYETWLNAVGYISARSQEDLKSHLVSEEYKDLLASVESVLSSRVETHLSQSFNGHIDQKPIEHVTQ
ncbi:hypothetical protein CKAH01_04832 [Colletotrichum kahawae]|uniref:Uncharacterized protein n=1 Tax=Colletotrichum kahawae TaxID=34407 RepID=A0AAD9YI82_COLKA|nr:hypothetical protein CKAH01_04832 [Colletotrichum kahawae]